MVENLVSHEFEYEIQDAEWKRVLVLYTSLEMHSANVEQIEAMVGEAINVIGNDDSDISLVKVRSADKSRMNFKNG